MMQSDEDAKQRFLAINPRDQKSIDKWCKEYEEKQRASELDDDTLNNAMKRFLATYKND